jgi:uncharacterized protein (DUF885 family)
MTTTSHRSDIFAFANDVVEHDASVNPLLATESGIPGYDHLMPDYSPEQVIADLASVQGFLRTLEGLAPADEIDAVAKSVMLERLQARLGLLESGESARTFSVISSPVMEMRQVFELMPASTPADLEVIAQRLRQVRPALATWRVTLETLRMKGTLPPRRHIAGVAEQLATFAAGGFRAFAARVSPGATDDDELRAAARDADEACGELSAWFTGDLEGSASEHDACGIDRYQVWARYFTGAALDLRELYEWGYADLRRINARMWEIARELVPGATSLAQVADFLDHDPSRRIDGTDELLARLRRFTEQAVEKLDGVHFDIDERIRFCDARLAPEGSAAAPYYIPPSEDLSRPGITWFPTLGRTTFSWWEHASTWYHEGVPGHHLQCATVIIERERLSRFHRLEAWISGYGEGWALYAERLMDELGFFSDPGEELGFLANQALRAARVMVDIGMHLELRAPDDFGPLVELGDVSGQTWTAEMAIAVLEEMAIQSHDMAASEVQRYLGIPGQAISYKVGERVWLRAREEARARLGADFSLKKFHAYSLRLGPMGLDPFEAEMRKWSGA